MRTVFNLTLVISLCSIPCPVLSAKNEFTLQEFGQLHHDVQPEKEAWTSIPWHADLLAAQNVAVRQNKPLFIWSMDGHPLGCT